MTDPVAKRAPVLEDKLATRTMALLKELVADYYPRDFAIELWDGSRLGPDAGQFCRFTWRINRASAIRALVRSDRQVALGAAYIYGEFDLPGDILGIFRLAEHVEEKRLAASTKLRLKALAFSLPATVWEREPELHGRIHSKNRDQKAVRFHYDVSNEFYELWLDPALVYSCAYFYSREDSLATAQTQKLDYICRKLRLRPGERLLDIGCGWGALILHAAENYGVEATGITLSPQQVVLARERIDRAGLGAHCQVQLVDYRDATKLGKFDKLVSVGMVEHVGEEKLSDYFRIAFDLLKPEGVFLNHGIGRAGNRSKPQQPTFTDVYVFPDGELVPISTMLRCAEQSGFEVRDVENLREHYFLTLCQWLRRIEASEEQAIQLVGELKYRIWRLYLAGSAYYFQSAKLGVYQSLLVKTHEGRDGLPLRREDWYR